MIMEFKEMSNQEKQWKAISLFAGAGGCSLGFKNAGVDILAAFENAEPAIITYNANFGNNICRNVDLALCDFQTLRNDLGLKRGELDLIIGGPPCQGFTTAGNRFGMIHAISWYKIMHKPLMYSIPGGL